MSEESTGDIICDDRPEEAPLSPQATRADDDIVICYESDKKMANESDTAIDDKPISDSDTVADDRTEVASDPEFGSGICMINRSERECRDLVLTASSHYLKLRNELDPVAKAAAQNMILPYKVQFLPVFRNGFQLKAFFHASRFFDKPGRGGGAVVYQEGQKVSKILLTVNE
ncbi:MAG: hypothetical protein Q9165_007984 [Trypethelium subeluteriae]